MLIIITFLLSALLSYFQASTVFFFGTHGLNPAKIMNAGRKGKSNWFFQGQPHQNG